MVKESETIEQLSLFLWASQVMLVGKNLPAQAGDRRDSGSIPGLQSVQPQRLRHDWAHAHTRRNLGLFVCVCLERYFLIFKGW